MTEVAPLKRPASVNRKHQLGKDPLSSVARTASATSLPTQPPTLTKDQGRLEIHDAGHTPDHPPRAWPRLLAPASRTRDPDQATHAPSLDEQPENSALPSVYRRVVSGSDRSRGDELHLTANTRVGSEHEYRRRSHTPENRLVGARRGSLDAPPRPSRSRASRCAVRLLDGSRDVRVGSGGRRTRRRGDGPRTGGARRLSDSSSTHRSLEALGRRRGARNARRDLRPHAGPLLVPALSATSTRRTSGRASSRSGARGHLVSRSASVAPAMRIARVPVFRWATIAASPSSASVTPRSTRRSTRPSW